MNANIDDREVILAVVDDRIGFLNHRFRNAPACTRFWAFRVMTTNSPGAGTSWTKFAIDRELGAARKTPLGEDEDDLYRAFALQLSVAGRRDKSWSYSRSHGTHVLDVASGYDYRVRDEVEIAKKIHLIGVQLPGSVVADTSGASMHRYLCHALEWIYVQAQSLGKNAKGKNLDLVLNFSYGLSAGGESGLHDVARCIEQFIAKYKLLKGAPRCYVVLPAGNHYLSRTSAQLELEAGEARELIFRLQPDDRTRSYVHIEMHNMGGGVYPEIAVELLPPVDPPATFQNPPEHPDLEGSLVWTSGGRVRAWLRHQFDHGSAGLGERVIAVTMPTYWTEDSGTDEGVFGEAPAGRWKLKVTNRSKSKRVVFCRIQRDGPLPNYRRLGRQAYFEDENYERFDEVGRLLVEDPAEALSPIRRDLSINAYAPDVPEAIVVGGYVDNGERSPARYSAMGRTNSQIVSAKSDDSEVHLGVLAAGTNSGSVVAQNGTSVAAPAFARELVECLLQANGNGMDPLHWLELAGKTTRTSNPRLGRRTAPRPVPHHRRRRETNSDGAASRRR